MLYLMSLEKGLLVVAVDKSNVVVCNSARLCCLWKRDYSAMNIDYTQRLKVQVVLQLGLLCCRWKTSGCC